jgi:hypothetical protein
MICGQDIDILKLTLISLKLKVSTTNSKRQIDLLHIGKLAH